jgi:hypothetical protein
MRLARTLVLVGALLPASAAAPPASASTAQPVTWKVDHKAKTITATVRLLLYPAGGVFGDDPRHAVTDRIVKEIYQQIMTAWNAGFTYRCYKLVFEVDILVDNGATRFQVPDDRIGVRIEREAIDFRSRTANKPAKNKWSSPSPDDRLIPENRYRDPTTWAWPDASGTNDAYAHEYGHILGLDDAYEDKTVDGKKKSVLRPGAPTDFMSMGGPLTQRTIDLLVQRSGAVKDSELRCGYRVKYDRGPVHIRGFKCDGPEGRWTLEYTMDVPPPLVVNRLTLALDVGPNLRGTWRVEVTDSVPRFGISASGGAGGTAVFQPGPPPTLEVFGPTLREPVKITLETDPPECAKPK